MAGLKKTGKKDSPNTVLVVALIFFILVSIGLGIFAYYGYDGQEALRAETKGAKEREASMKTSRDMLVGALGEAMLAANVELTPVQKDDYKRMADGLIRDPKAYEEIKPVVDALRREYAILGTFSEAELKYPTTINVLLKAKIDEARAAKAESDATKKEYETFKSNYDDLVKKFEAAIAKTNADIEAGNKAALAQAARTNDQFPAIQKKLVDMEKARAALNDQFIAEKGELENRIARLNQQIAKLEQEKKDRALGVEQAPQAAAIELQALMLDISSGRPIWDKAIGKIVRVDATNLQVHIDLGKKKGIVPDVTFNVFGTSVFGKAEGIIKGTVEVIRVLDDHTSLARVTSLYDERGEPISLFGPDGRARAAREAENLFKEGDLLFHPFYDMHVFVAGNVNLAGYGADSPAAQQLQLMEFIHLLRKHRIVVDGYVNLQNGQIEGAVTPKTRMLVKGDMAVVKNTEEEQARVKLITEAFQVVRKQAIDQGMFLISSENFLNVVGYRAAHSQYTRDIGFRPVVPYVGSGPLILRDAPAAPAAPMPPAEEKKDAN